MHSRVKGPLDHPGNLQHRAAPHVAARPQVRGARSDDMRQEPWAVGSVAGLDRHIKRVVRSWRAGSCRRRVDATCGIYHARHRRADGLIGACDRVAQYRRAAEAPLARVERGVLAAPRCQ